MTNIPRGPHTQTPDHALREIWEQGLRYIDRLGWAVYLEWTGASGRVPYPKCPECRVTCTTSEAKQSCLHLTCHSFHSATSDRDRFTAMVANRPNATHLCVGTGHRSGIVVLDFDVDKGGLDSYDDWNATSQQSWSPPPTLTQRTKSGGLHLVYRLPDDWSQRISSRADVLPGVDIRGDGGMIVVDPSPGYSWLARVMPSTAPPELLAWLVSVRPNWWRRRAGRSSGFSERLEAEILPNGMTVGQLSEPGMIIEDGSREGFAAGFAFKLRKTGVDWDDAVRRMYERWQHFQQPPIASHTFEWRHVYYKLEQVWRDHQPDGPSMAVQRWLQVRDVRETLSRNGTAQVGRVTLGRRPQ